MHGIATLRTKADDTFEQLKRRFGDKSAANTQNEAAGEKNVAAGGSTGNWLQSKLNENLFSAHAVKNSTLGGQPDAATSTLFLPIFTLPDTAVAEMQNLITLLRSKVDHDAELTFRRISAEFAPGAGLDVVTSGLGAIIDVIAGAVDIAFDIAEAAVSALLHIIEIVLEAARDFSKQELKIPFLSELYHYATGETLTVFGLGALLVAVPAWVAIDAATLANEYTAQAMRVSRELSEGEIWGIIAGAAQIVSAFFSAGIAYLNLFVEQITHAPTTFGAAVEAIILIGPGLAARALQLTSEILEKGDAGKAVNLWLWLFLSTATDIVAAGIKVYGIKNENELLARSAAYVSVLFGALFGLADTIAASTTITFEDDADVWDWRSHFWEDVSLFVRVAGLVIPTNAGIAQGVLIVGIFVCLVVSGACAIKSSALPNLPRVASA